MNEHHSSGTMRGRSRWRRLLLICAAAATAGILSVYLFQDSMIYFPRRYSADYQASLPRGTLELDYSIRVGGRSYPQSAFYVPPEPEIGPQPEVLWVLFHGNASLATDWVEWVSERRAHGAGFLLIEFPGYGRCLGKSSSAAIGLSSDEALAELSRKLGSEGKEINSSLCVAGHSLGCAAGLQFAARHPVEQIVLAAPFTSLRDMARLRAGWPLCLLLRDEFDNRARMSALLARPDPPKITILHGANDAVVPVSMGKDLASLSPRVTLVDLPADDHTSVLDAALELLDRRLEEHRPLRPEHLPSR